jgi:hypothetical protein
VCVRERERERKRGNIEEHRRGSNIEHPGPPMGLSEERYHVTWKSLRNAEFQASLRPTELETSF